MIEKNFRPSIRRLLFALFLLGAGIIYAQQAPTLTVANTKDESWDFTIRVMTQTFATETVFFSQAEGVTTFTANAVLFSQGQPAILLASGKTDDSRIVEYALDVDYNGKRTMIEATVKGDVLEVRSGERVITLPWTPNTILLDNNMSFMWQYFLYYYPYAGTNDFIAVIPQLVVSQDTIAFPFTIQRAVESDGKVTLNFSLASSLGIINASNRYRLSHIQIGVTKMERTR